MSVDEVADKPDGPQGPYTVWMDGGYDGWYYKDFPTLQAAVENLNYNYKAGFIQKTVHYTVTEKMMKVVEETTG